MKSAWESSLAISIVLIAHIGAIGFAVWAPESKPKPIELPVIQGIFIPAPAAEVEAPPTAKVPPPPKPKEKPPEPKPKPKPKPLPPPPVELPPSETAIEQEAVEEVAEVAQEEVVQDVPHTPVISDEDRLGSTVTPPRSDAASLNNPQPRYPPMSRRLREEGIVVLELLILANGSVGDVKLKKSSGFSRLDETAMTAVKYWRYMPAKRGGQSIDYWYEQSVEFKLSN